MSATVDSLSIKVDASARSASKQLDILVEKMIKLRSTVDGISVGNLNNLSLSIQNFSKAAKGLGEVKTADFTRMAKGIEKLSNIRKGELNRAATAITNISKALSSMGNVSEGADKIGQLASGISKLGYKSSTQAIDNIPKLTTVIRDMMAELSRAPSVSNNLINMTNAMANLAKHAGGLRNLSNGMSKAVGDMFKCQGALSRLAGGMSHFGNGARDAIFRLKGFALQSKNASKSTASFISKLGMLYAKIWSIKRICDVFGKSIGSAMDYIETYNYFQAGFGQVASNADLSQWKELGFRSARQYAESFQNEAEKLTAKMTGFEVQDNGELISTGLPNLGMDPDKLMNYQAMFAQMSSSMGVASGTATDLSRVLTEIGADLASVKNIDFKSAWEDMASGLTGMSRTWDKYGVNIRNANLKQKLHELGIKANINALGQNDKALLRTIVLLESTKYAWGDMSSTINQPANQLRLLKNNFSSISRQIGNIFLPIVAKTLPYLNAFAIAVRRLVEYVGSLLGVNTELFKNTGGDNSGLSDLMDDAESASTAVDDTTDSVKKLSKQLMGFDELNVITTNDSKKKDKEDEDSGANITSALTDALDDVMSDYQKVWNKKFKEMQNDAEKFADKLTKLFKNAWTSGDGSDIGSAIAGWLNKGISWVNKNVDKFAAGLKKIANMLATGVNGFVEKLNWAGLGTAIGKSLKAFFDAETHFFDKVNWVNLGKSLATSLNSAIDTGVLQSYFKSIASKLRAAIETAFGAVTTFKFDKLGSALGQGINDFFKTMGKVNKQTGLNGWQELGKTLSDGISGITESLAVALETVEWEDVGQAIADFIGEINTGDIGWKLGKLAKSLATAFYTLVSDQETWASLGTKIGDGINKFFKSMNTVDKKTGLTGWETLGESISNTIKGITGTITTALETVEWIEVGNAIGDLIAGIKWGEVAWDFVEMADEAFGAVCDAIAKIHEKAPLETAIVDLFAGLALTGVLGKITDAITLALAGKNLTLGKVAIGVGLGAATLKLANKGDWTDSILAAITAFMAAKTFTGNTKLSLKIAAVTIALAGGFTLGKKIGEWIQDQISPEDMKEYRYEFKFTDLFSYSPEEWAQGMADWWVDVEDWWGGVKDWWENKKDKLVLTIKGKIDETVDKVKEKWDSIKSKTAELVASAKEKVQGALATIHEGWEKVKDKTSSLIAEAKEKAAGALDKLKGAWNDIKSSTVVKTLEQKGKNIIDSVKKSWDAIKSGKVTKTLKQSGKNTIKAAAEVWGKIKDGTVTKTLKQKGKKTIEGIRDTWDAIKSKTIFGYLNVDAIKSAIKTIINWINKYIIGAINKISVKIPNWVPKMGGKTFGFDLKEIKLPAAFASGGFPQQGQYFLARESGPELVGTIGGKSAVVNNPQIVQSVSDGVFNALAPVLTQVVNAVNGLQANSQGGQPLYVEGVSDGDIVRITTRANSDYKKRFGKPLYI